VSAKRRSPPARTGGNVASARSVIPAGYAAWLASLKARIASAPRRAALAANEKLVRMYHHLGTEILQRQERQGRGAKVIDQLASDLHEAFPEMKGFSSRNLKCMKQFAQMCPDLRIGQQPAAQFAVRVDEHLANMGAVWN